MYRSRCRSRAGAGGRAEAGAGEIDEAGVEV
jgi:hypothetical protein